MRKLLLLSVTLLFVSCGRSINKDAVPFEVKRGESIHKVARNLEEQKIIKDAFKFRLIAKITGKEKSVKFGEYVIPAKTSYANILKIIGSGKGRGFSVIIKEGLNLFEIAALLEDKGVVGAEDFFAEVSDKKWFQEFGIPTLASEPIQTVHRFSDYNGHKFAAPYPAPPMIEGYLYPDTYHLQSNMSAFDVVNTMTKRFKQVVKTQRYEEKAAQQSMSLHRLIVFASIVQKEAGSIEEMPEVAGVYSNRIIQNMRMQADPTLIYALILDNEYRGNIRSKHLRPPWPSPYNTYARRGLPPHPIASPGKDAIDAVLNPVEHNFLYFVRDPDGSHTYSSNLEDHNAAVRKWVDYKRGR
ncbi:MAG: endolytic transglycosylase MltG [Brevinema sp.]